MFFNPMTAPLRVAANSARCGIRIAGLASSYSMSTLLYTLDIIADIDAAVAQAEADRLAARATTAIDHSDPAVYVVDGLISEAFGSETVIASAPSNSDQHQSAKSALVVATTSAVHSALSAVSSVLTLRSAVFGEPDSTAATNVPVTATFLDLVVAVDATAQHVRTVCRTLYEAASGLAKSLSPRNTLEVLTATTGVRAYRPSAMASAALRIAAMTHRIHTHEGATIALAASLQRVLC